MKRANSSLHNVAG